MFLDRTDAALKLAQALDRYKDQGVVVLGIPRGGVEIAYHVALHLNAEFSLIITRKLGYPDNPEAAFGSIAEDGSVYIPEENSGLVSENTIKEIVARERREILRRIKTLRKGKPLPPLEGKVVIIVDDGVATGATLMAAIVMCRKKAPAKLVVAAPISDRSMEYVLRKMADEVTILEKPLSFYAVGQGYQRFENVSDQEALEFVNTWEKNHP